MGIGAEFAGPEALADDDNGAAADFILAGSKEPAKTGLTPSTERNIGGDVVAVDAFVVARAGEEKNRGTERWRAR